MTSEPADEGHLFVVRLRNEPSTAPARAMRGVVEHVPSGQRLYFSRLADLNDFIELRIASPVAARRKD